VPHAISDFGIQLGQTKRAASASHADGPYLEFTTNQSGPTQKGPKRSAVNMYRFAVSHKPLGGVR